MTGNTLPTIASVYPCNIQEALEQRSNIPTQVLDIDGWKITVEADEIITKVEYYIDETLIVSTDITRFKGKRLIKNDYGSLGLVHDEDLFTTFETNNDTIMYGGGLLFIKGMSAGQLITYISKKYDVPLSLMKESDTSKLYLSNDEIDHLLSVVDGISYPKDLKLYYKVFGGSGYYLWDLNTRSYINRLFVILDKLAKEKRYWRPETFHLL